MRVYNEDKVRDMTYDEKMNALNLVKTNPDLTLEEKEANIDLIESHLAGVLHSKHGQIMKDIEDGMADISDMGENKKND